MHYHAHIFFAADQHVPAEGLRQVLSQLLPNGVRVGPFLPRAAGPLPGPMFQLDYPQTLAEQVEAVLRQQLHGRSALIHPVLQDERAAHTRHAKWLGPELPVHLDRL